MFLAVFFERAIIATAPLIRVNELLTEIDSLD
jgi:hypothetical protein